MPKQTQNKGPASRAWTFFSSVKLSVIVLLALAATSIIGTLIPQNASPAFYFQKYGEVFYRLFTALDIVDMYHSWWFLLLLGLLAVNIIVCSIDRLSSTWKIIFPAKISFNLSRFARLKEKQTFVVSRPADRMADGVERFLADRFSHVVKEETGTGIALFSEKGRWTRLGVYVVHLSILMLLAGAVIGSIGGFKGFVAIPEGEMVDHVPLGDTGKAVDLGFAIRCNRFAVTFYDTGHPKEFKSNLTLIKDGKELLTSDILVNHPLRFNGINIFQSSYGTSSVKSLEMAVTNKESGMSYSVHLEPGGTVELPENGGTFTLEKFVQGYNFRGHNIGESFVGMRKDKAGNEIPVVMPVQFPTFDRMRGGQFQFVATDYEKNYYTGLQVTKDPGVWFVYIGFLLMIAGCWVTFFMSHQSVCVELRRRDKTSTEVIVAGIANRNSQSMKIKAERFAEKIKEID